MPRLLSRAQLQMEVEKRESWYMASADSGTLLKELLSQAKALPPPETAGEGAGEGNAADSSPSVELSQSLLASELVGIDTWSSLMRSIGKEAEVVKSEGTLADKMLKEWVRARLLPKPPRPTPSTPPPAVTAGTVLCSMVPVATGRPANRFLLEEQPLHKGLVLVLADSGIRGGVLSGAILNRPTANAIQFSVAGKPRRRVPYCGSRDLGGQLWLHHNADLGGVAIGESGLYRSPPDEVADMLEDGTATPSDFLLVSSTVEFSRAELAGMLTAGEMSVVPSGPKLIELWPRVWSLTEDDGEVSDGTEVWWLASQCGAEQPTAAPPSEIGDEALDEWLKFFARGPNER